MNDVPLASTTRWLGFHWLDTGLIRASETRPAHIRYPVPQVRRDLTPEEVQRWLDR